MSDFYKSEEEKYIAWYKEAKEKDGLIDVKFYAGEIHGTDTEQFYREANYFNSQLDDESITPRIEVSF